MLIAGDIGGTKTYLALYLNQSIKASTPIVESTFTNSNFNDFYEILNSFVSSINGDITKICLGVAGPVIDGEVKLTNINWTISEKRLKSDYNFGKVKLLNDLEALAYYIPHLNQDDFVEIQPGKFKQNHNIVVIGIGTGLGEAFLTWNDQNYDIHHSEGGHSDFSPKNDEEVRLLQFLINKYDYVNVESVCSAIGICNIYLYLKNSVKMQINDELQDIIKNSTDPSKIIIQDATSKIPSKICSKTLEIFVSILATEIGNFALKLIPSSGVYLGGGIPNKIVKLLKKESFLRILKDKGKMSHLLDQFPIRVILNSRSGLYGSAYCCVRNL